MTDAPKIDTQAPKTLWLDIGTFNGAVGFDHSKQHHAGEWKRYVAEDLADARAAAAWQAAIGALLDEVGGLPISEIAADEVIYATKLLQPPADTQAALDRLIAERVREAVDRALRDAVAICKKVRNENAENEDQAVGALDCAVSIMDEVNRRARSSNEGRDG